MTQDTKELLQVIGVVLGTYTCLAIGYVIGVSM